MALSDFEIVALETFELSRGTRRWDFPAGQRIEEPLSGAELARLLREKKIVVTARARGRIDRPGGEH